MDLYDSMLQSATVQRLQRARVRAVPAQHSWAALPGPLVSKLLDSQAQTPLVIKLIPAPTAASQTSRSPFSNSSSTPAAPSSFRARYIAWAGAVSTTPGCIELPAHLCSALQLPTGCEVLLEVVPALAAAAAVVVEPVGPADWEVVELNAGLLEENVLGQAGVVVLGQPLVVWARQAKVTLKVTQVIHDNAAAAGAAPGRQLYVRDVARLDQGTELHIAPKPRVTAAGSSLAPGTLPLGVAAAGSDIAQQQTSASAQQQQTKQQRKPVWLRVCSAGTQHLLETSSLLGHNGATGCNDSSSNNGHSSGRTAEANASSGPATAEGTAAAVSSWLTTAVHISRQTSQDLALQPGEIVRLYSSSSNSSRGQSVLPLQSLVVAVLIQDTVPWGHVALSPPLQQGLGLREHQFVKMKPLQKQKQLQQLPGFLLHLLMPAGVGSSGSSSNGGGLQGLLAAAAMPGQQAAVAAGSQTHAAGVSGSSARQQQQHRQLSDGRKQQQQLQQPGVDSFSGPGLVLDTVKGLLTMPLQVVRLQSSLQQQSQQQASANKPQQQQQQQQRSRGDTPLPLTAAGAASTVGDRVGGVLVDGLVKPKVAAAALLAWLQVQLAASAAAAVAASPQQPEPVPEQGKAEAGSKEAGSQGTHGGSRWAAVCLPVCGPMLVHFRVGPQQQQQQVQQQQQQKKQDGQHSVDMKSSCDYLLLLVPLGEQHQGAASAAGVSYLPASLLLPSKGNGHHAAQQQQQVKQLSVQVARPLMFDQATAQADQQISPVAQQHSQYVSCIYSRSTVPQCLQYMQASIPQPQQQQQQQQQSVPGWLEPGEYPWLAPALQSSLQRLQPRLDLLTWQSWQSVELPLPGGVLLVGSSEGGRGWLMQLLGQEAATKHGAHVLKVSCKSLAGQSYETAAAVLASAAAEAVSCCPGLLLLDDLDLLMPAPNTEGPAGLEQDQATATRLADWLSGLMQWAAKQPRPLSFCAAVSAAAALPASLRAAGCLDCKVKVPTLGLQGRAALLLSGFRAKGLGFHGGLQGLEALAGKGLEGFDAKDLQLIVDRAVHSALRRGMVTGQAGLAVDAASSAVDAAGPAEGDSVGQQQQQQQLLVTSEDVQQALSGFVAAAFWRAGQQKGQQQKHEGGLEGWQDVGGLSDAVSALKEALVLPAKYGHLLAAAPLRLRTGLLLFGPPGCGKTHVVAAAVAATGARLISVKGPELLNKYIGQSEAAVRELFNRAAAAAPCVLFFDEFDAIAPPRGHDSTGVTDRVVNQLLTELDGVEGLTGVAVLAATSRPDLIDAALLRPGRLDRMVYCGFPGEADRLAILQAVGRKLALSAGVSLQGIARSTAGFTGADLAAILSEAQLLAVHDQIDSHPDQQQEAQEQGEAAAGAPVAACVLTAQHVQRALSRARPSLPATEKQRLEAVYARFQQSRDPGLSNRPAVPEEEQMRVKHATLA